MFLSVNYPLINTTGFAQLDIKILEHCAVKEDIKQVRKPPIDEDLDYFKCCA